MNGRDPAFCRIQMEVKDVGLWHREKLVKLCDAIPGAFTMKDHSEFDYSPEDAKKYIDPQEVQNQTDVLQGIVNPPVEFDYPPQVNISEKTHILFKDTLHTGSIAMDMKSFDDAFFTRTEGSTQKNTNEDIQLESKSQKPERKSQGEIGCNDNTDELREKMLAWNNTPSSIVMQIHVEKHKLRQDSTSFNVKEILKGNRSNFGQKGPIERSSEEFLQAAMIGDLQSVKKFLNDGHVHVDVADKIRSYSFNGNFG